MYRLVLRYRTANERETNKMTNEIKAGLENFISAVLKLDGQATLEGISNLTVNCKAFYKFMDKELVDIDLLIKFDKVIIWLAQNDINQAKKNAGRLITFIYS